MPTFNFARAGKARCWAIVAALQRGIGTTIANRDLNSLGDLRPVVDLATACDATDCFEEDFGFADYHAANLREKEI